LLKVLAVVQEDFGLGLNLAGVVVNTYGEQKEGMNALREALSAREYGIVIIEEQFFNSLDSRYQKDLLRNTHPLVVPIPAEMRWKDTEEISEDDLVARLIRQAVGYQLNIQV